MKLTPWKTIPWMTRECTVVLVARQVQLAQVRLFTSQKDWRRVFRASSMALSQLRCGQPTYSNGIANYR